MRGCPPWRMFSSIPAFTGWLESPVSATGTIAASTQDSRHCQMSLGGGHHSWLRTTDLAEEANCSQLFLLRHAMIKKHQGQKGGSVVEWFPGMCEALGIIPSTIKKGKKNLLNDYNMNEREHMQECTRAHTLKNASASRNPTRVHREHPWAVS